MLEASSITTAFGFGLVVVVATLAVAFLSSLRRWRRAAGPERSAHATDLVWTSVPLLLLAGLILLSAPFSNG